MRKLIFKIKAILLALMVLVSSNTYAITSHFCGEELVEVSYFGDDVGCAMEKINDYCNTKKKVKKKCCSDKRILLEAEDYNIAKELNLDFEALSFTAAFLAFYFELFSDQEITEYYFLKEFPPPDAKQNIQVLHQTFLL